MKTLASQAATLIRQQCPDFKPVLGIILGSGLTDLLFDLQDSQNFAYADLPGFVSPGVTGHRGELVIGQLAGVPVVCLRGRCHLYESLDHRALPLPLLTLQQLGCNTVLITNAAGALRTELQLGSLVLVTDHINLQAVNPLVGLAKSDARFVDMTDAYDVAHRDGLLCEAAQRAMTLHQGVYCAMLGPSFETPAEVNMLCQLGGDVVGMSTVPEVIVARYCGMRVVAISVVSNMAAGLATARLSHAQTMTVTQAAIPNLLTLLTAFVTTQFKP